MSEHRKDCRLDTDIYAYAFEPIFKERIWGGRNLERFFAKRLPADVKIGESWELADLPEDKSCIANGPLAGMTLAEAIERYGAAITGKTGYDPPFPLLIKLLDANDVLSVQVHPDAETCKRMQRGAPKTECWYIIAAEPGAIIYKGLIAGTTRKAFAAAVRDGTCERYLNKVAVRPGECHFLPAGTCHAIGAGLLIAEIQQPSDTTYRVFDWNRVDSTTGQGRELHIDAAMESIHFDSSGDDLSVRTMGRLVSAEAFTIDKGHQMPGCEVLLSPGKMKVVIFITGAGHMAANETVQVEFRKGDAVLVPASFAGVMSFSQDSEYLTVTV
ncbi:MAG: class I mannose-6-phosphate isomerase [Phycisphaerae bacterium]|nr:class I mannose-6-phosphate isomerase [Phycisphaerae bacterium]